ncbi:hypothetical protein [Dietzia sp. UBA5065]|jgi:hypothetical protein|uniref:hypothetical protein n=1 Tax=Dietzia sp. UBA5065 TaxID=1946422 RepID=UPI0025BD99E6|nr:hypothetical protein [Dietzia sp. UBA5065]
MFVRKVVTASAATVTLLALAVPVVNAQGEGPGSGSAGSGVLDGGSLEGGSLEGSLSDGSESGGSAEGSSEEDGSSGSGSLDSGSLDSGSGEDTSVGDLVPEPDGVCELPDLGGSVAKFYPLFGISGIPTAVINLVTSALGSFPNLLDVVAGEGGGAALLGDTGSFAGPLCTSILGGEMILPPVTVIVDGSGTPITTVTGTVVRSSTSAVTHTSTSTAASTPSGPAGAPGGTGTVALPTSVPTPGA